MSMSPEAPGGDYRCVFVNVEAAQAVREDVASAMRIILGELGYPPTRGCP